MPSSWLQWAQVKCSGCHVRPNAVITCAKQQSLSITCEFITLDQSLLGADVGSLQIQVLLPKRNGLHLSDDGLLAGVAASLLRGLYSLAAHVCAEGSEHMLERGGFWLSGAAAVVLLPRTLLAIHVGSALASCAAHLQNKKQLSLSVSERISTRYRVRPIGVTYRR